MKMAFIFNSVKKMLGWYPHVVMPHVGDAGSTDVAIAATTSVTPEWAPAPADDEEDYFEDAVASQVAFDDAVSVVAYGPDSGEVGKTIRRREKEPAKFNGKCDFSAYKIQFDYVATWNRWTHEDMGLQLAMCLTDEAREVLSCLRVTEKHNYDALVEALECRYHPKGR